MNRRVTLARAAAWALLLAGWVGIGSFALVLAPGVAAAFALVALWLLALGGAALIATRDLLTAGARAAALIATAVLGTAALVAAPRGGGVGALVVALLAWAALTALASGVVRSLRQGLAQPPGPPIGAAAVGACAAAIALGDPSDLQVLALRLGTLVLAAALLLALLPWRAATRAPASRCRAGLFDCSLPAWPAGAWRDARQWPALIAGLAMLPMMAALPLMVAWCRGEAVDPRWIVALHLAAMFAPAWLVRRSIAGWPPQRLSGACAALLAAGGVCALWAPAAWQWLGVAAAHGAAWGLAWAGQLWSPERRGRQGASPLRAALGYAALTLGFGAAVAQWGVAGVTATHALIALLGAIAWLTVGLIGRRHGTLPQY